MSIVVRYATSGILVYTIPKEQGGELPTHYQGQRVQFLANRCTVNSNDDYQCLLESMAEDESLELSMFVLSGPAWYPIGRYMHRGKEVLRIIFKYSESDMRLYHTAYTIYFLDGTTEQSPDWQGNPWCTKHMDFIESLIRQLGFKLYKQNRCSVGTSTDFSADWLGVPPEDPEVERRALLPWSRFATELLDKYSSCHPPFSRRFVLRKAGKCQRIKAEAFCTWQLLPREKALIRSHALHFRQALNLPAETGMTMESVALLHACAGLGDPAAELTIRSRRYERNSERRAAKTAWLADMPIKEAKELHVLADHGSEDARSKIRGIRMKRLK